MPNYIVTLLVYTPDSLEGLRRTILEDREAIGRAIQGDNYNTPDITLLTLQEGA